MASVGAVALGIAGRLATITGLDVTDYVPDVVNAPSGFVTLTDLRESVFGGDSVDMTFDAVIVANRTNDRTSERLLYGFASFTGSSSVFAAINADPSLGGLAGTRARGVSARHLSATEIAAYGYFGIAVSIEVTTPG